MLHPNSWLIRFLTKVCDLLFLNIVLVLADVTLPAVLRGALYAETLLMPPTVLVLLSILTVFLTALLSYLFPLLARYENTFSRHLSNAARLALANLPITVLITAVNLLPLLISLLFPALLGVVFAFWLLFGFATGAWINSFYLNRIFESREDG